jgi:hypothetical protein
MKNIEIPASYMNSMDIEAWMDKQARESYIERAKEAKSKKMEKFYLDCARHNGFTGRFKSKF